MNCPGS